MRRLVVTTSLLLFSVSAAAQSTNPAQPTAEDPTRPGPDRVPVHIEAARTRSMQIGVAPVLPARERRDAEFSNEPHVPGCTTPCTLYLRPGLRRLIGDASSEFAWSADLMIPNTPAAQVRLRGHLPGISALGGAMFVVGLGGALLGPGLIIVSAIVNERPITPPFVVGGVVAGVLGIASAISGYVLVRFAAPRAEAVQALSTPTRTAATQAVRAMFAPQWSLGPLPEGGLLASMMLRFP